MSIEIRVPSAGESVTSGLLATWLKEDGAPVNEGDELFEFETDKATIAVPAPASGILRRLSEAGRDVEVGSVVGEIVTAQEAGAGAKAPANPASADAAAGRAPGGEAGSALSGAARSGAAGNGKGPSHETTPAAAGREEQRLSPAVRRVVEENRLDAVSIAGTGKGGRITKGDALAAAQAVQGAPAAKAGGATAGGESPAALAEGSAAARTGAAGGGKVPAAGSAAGGAAARAQVVPRVPGERQSRVPMTTIRKRIAENLVRAKQQAAHLTTFNEIDMSAVMELRSRYKEPFEQRYGVRLGFMSFFVKASVEALKEVPAVNAQIDGENIIYNNYYDVGVAVASERGLVVPVVRDADRLSFDEVERSIADLAARARDKRLTVDELTGGTFTITNGGVFGSLLSTPIPNYPQSAILGMHTIQKRPVVVDDQIAIRPMMYVALTYDHRIVDGQGAVTFLVRIKQLIEEPTRLLLNV